MPTFSFAYDREMTSPDGVLRQALFPFWPTDLLSEMILWKDVRYPWRLLLFQYGLVLGELKFNVFLLRNPPYTPFTPVKIPFPLSLF